jgi:hypothetical protein
MNTIEAETETFLDTSATPEPVAPATEVDGYYNDKALQHALDEGLAVLAEDESPEAYDRYKAERLDRKALASGDPSYKKDGERQQARVERWGGIMDTVAEARAASEAALKAEQPPHQDEINDELQYREDLGRATGEIRRYEMENPGFEDDCARTAREHGWFAPSVRRTIIATSHVPEVIAWICENQPSMIPVMNQAVEAGRHRDVERYIDRVDGYVEKLRDEGEWGAARQAPPAPAVSTAPAPIRTVTGRSSPSSKSPEEMNMDEYRAWRTKEMARKR